MACPADTQAQIEAIIERHSALVYRLAFASTRSKNDAEDLYQEVFLRYIKNMPVFTSREHERAWFIRVTVNQGKSYWRSAWKRKTVALEEEPPAPVKPEDQVHALLEKLPLKYRTVLHLYYYEDYSIEQISRILGIRPATLRTQLTRARRLLGQIVKGEQEYEQQAGL